MTTSPSPEHAGSESLIEQAVAEYFTAIDQGVVLSVDEMIGKYPEVESELSQFFETVDVIEEMAGPVSSESTNQLKQHAVETGTHQVALRRAAKSPSPAAPSGPSTTAASGESQPLNRDGANGVESTGFDASTVADDSSDSEQSATIDTMISESAVDETRAGSGESFLNASVGEMFGRYRIEKELGQGAMGAVYLAHDTELARDVALKIPKFRQDDLDVMERFLREARSAATLHHRNICPVFDVGDVEGRRFITMAFIEGKPLSAYTKSDKRVPQNQVALLIHRLASVLERAHEKGVLHRDLKPANIMIDGDGEPVVMDFGLARRLDPTESERITQSGALLGSPAYMSPEQIEGVADEIGVQSDVYSLGVVCYELLAGILPFKGSIASVIGQIMSKEPIPPSTHRPDLDPGLEAICLKMIAKNKGERFGSMKEVADAFGRWLAAPHQSASDSNVSARFVAEPQMREVTIPSANTRHSGRVSVASSAKSRRGATRGPSIPWWKNRRVLWGGGFGLFTAIVAGLIVIVQTEQGVLRVELNDPKIQVRVEGEAVVLSKKGQKEIRMTPGQKTIKIDRDGFPFGATSFRLQEGKVVTVQVDLIDPEQMSVRVKETGQVLASLNRIPGAIPSPTSPTAVPIDLVNPHPAIPTALRLSEDESDFLEAVSLLAPAPRRDAVIRKLEELQIMPGNVSRFGENSEFTEAEDQPGNVIAARISAPGVAYLWPLVAFPNIESLDLIGTSVVDFTPLQSLSLTDLKLELNLYNLEAETVLRSLPALITINGQPAEAFWKSRKTQRDEIERFQVASKSLATADIVAWLEHKLNELNPKAKLIVREGGVDGHNVVGYQITSERKDLHFRFCDNVSELAPLRAIEFDELRGSFSTLYDITALQDLPLRSLEIDRSHVHDLSPLHGMPLTRLSLPIGGCIKDLEPLRGLQLSRLILTSNPVSNLEPLKGMPLTELDLSGCPVTTLAPLAGMKLETLLCSGTALVDLSPLTGMSLKSLDIEQGQTHDWYGWGNWGPAPQPIQNLSPLNGMALTSLTIGNRDLSVAEIDLMQSLPLQRINGLTVEEYWESFAVITPSRGWVDVKVLIDPATDLTGDLDKTDSKELVVGYRNSTLSLPLAIQGDYQLRATFTLLNGPKSLIIQLPISNSLPGLVLADWDNETGYMGAGINTIGDLLARHPDNPTHIEEPIINNEKQSLELTLSSQNDEVTIRGTLDDKPLVDWTGPETKLPEEGDNPSRKVMVWLHKGSLELHSLELKMKTGTATPIP